MENKVVVNQDCILIRLCYRLSHQKRIIELMVFLVRHVCFYVYFTPN